MATIKKIQRDHQVVELKRVLDGYFKSNSPHKAIKIQVQLHTYDGAAPISTDIMNFDVCQLAELIGSINARLRLEASAAGE